MANQKIDLVSSGRSPVKTIALLAWPTIAEQLLQTMTGYVDAAMVGSLGAEATAAVAVNTSLAWLLAGTMNAATLGFSIQLARHIGGGNSEAAGKTVRQGMLVLLFGGLGIVLLMETLAGFIPTWLGAQSQVRTHAVNYLRIVSGACLFQFSLVMCGGFLRSAGDTRTPLRVNIFANLVNVCGNYLLIFPRREAVIFGQKISLWGAGMGVEGAAAATSFSVVLAGALLFFVLFKKNNILGLRLRGDYARDDKILKTALTLATPMALERFGLSSGQLVITRLVAGLGTVPLAAYYLCNLIESASYLPGFGLAVAATTLVGQALGAQNRELAKTYGKYCLCFGVVMMSLAGFGLFLFSDGLIRFFTPDAGVAAFGAMGLRLMAFGQPFNGLNIVGSGILRGGGDTRAPFLVTASGMWAIRMGLVLLLGYGFDLGVYGAWLAMIADLVYRGSLSYWLYRKGKWLYLWGT